MLLKKLTSIFKNDGEADFVEYLKYTDPYFGQEDPSLAVQYLEKAVDADHPDATFVKGTLLFNGEYTGRAQDKRAGFMLMKKGRDMGASLVDEVTSMWGIDLDDEDYSSQSKVSEYVEAENIQEMCKSRIDDLRSLDEISVEQKEDLYELVRTLDALHLINVFSILSNPKELKKMAGLASRITGWDPVNATFFLAR